MHYHLIETPIIIIYQNSELLTVANLIFIQLERYNCLKERYYIIIMVYSNFKHSNTECEYYLFHREIHAYNKNA